jgi:hypothetical protein
LGLKVEEAGDVIANKESKGRKVILFYLNYRLNMRFFLRKEIPFFEENI